MFFYETLNNFLDDLELVVLDMLDTDVVFTYDYNSILDEEFSDRICTLFYKHCKSISDSRYIIDWFDVTFEGIHWSSEPFSNHFEEFRNAGLGDRIYRVLLDELQLIIDIEINAKNS